MPRQSLTLVGTEAGPLEAAGKDVAGVVKSIDAKLAAVGIVAEKVKSQCKDCPSVSRSLLLYTKLSLSYRYTNTVLPPHCRHYTYNVAVVCLQKLSCDKSQIDPFRNRFRQK